MAFFVLVLFLLIPYEIHAYALMCIGRKAGLKSDWMPYIPVARQIYQMQIADCPIWYIFLFSCTTITVALAVLVSLLIGLLIKNAAFISILIIIYVLADIVFTFLYFRRFYCSFGFNPNTALLTIIPTFNTITMVFDMLIAFSNSISYGDYYEGIEKQILNREPSGGGTIIGVSGPYANSNFTIEDGTELIFGRDPQQANIVFDGSQSDVSRNHCTIRFDGRNDVYIITDHSSTGTYLDNGSRLQKEVSQQVPVGTTIYLGSSKKNGFCLS